MTTLRSFQNEIDEIHHREAVKQRVQALAEQEKLKDAKKTPVKSPTKAVAAETKVPADQLPVHDAEGSVDDVLNQDKIQVRFVLREELHTRLMLGPGAATREQNRRSP